MTMLSHMAVALMITSTNNVFAKCSLDSDCEKWAWPTEAFIPSPTAKPTDFYTNMDTKTCGDYIINSYYSGQEVQFQVRMPYEGTLTVTYKSTLFVVAIEAYGPSDELLARNARNNDGNITLTDIQQGDYSFIIYGIPNYQYYGALKWKIQCYSSSPMPHPTPTPTFIPTTDPSEGPTSNPTSNPTTSPTPKPTANPTPTPTLNPAFNPTKTTTTAPTHKPTTSPTQPDVMSCGDESLGLYTGDILQFDGSIPFDGHLIFDSSNSKFNVTDIEISTRLGHLLATDSDHDGVIKTPIVAGDYKFILQGNMGTDTSAIYHIKLQCISDQPTSYPSRSPFTTTTNPTLPEAERTHVTEPVIVITDNQMNEDTGDDLLEKIKHFIFKIINDPLSLIISICCICIILCVICCVICMCYKSCSKKKKYDYEGDEMVTIKCTNFNTIPQIGIEGEDIDLIAPVADTHEMKQTKKLERQLVISWFTSTVRMPQYIKMFMNQGYENMRAVQMIQSKEELRDVGVKIPGHQQVILFEIEKLKRSQNKMDGDIDITSAESVPLQPPPARIITAHKQRIEYDEVDDENDDEDNDEYDDMYEPHHTVNYSLISTKN